MAIKLYPMTNFTDNNKTYSHSISLFWLIYTVQSAYNIQFPSGIYPALYAIVAFFSIKSFMYRSKRSWNILSISSNFLFFCLVVASLLWVPQGTGVDTNQRLIIYLFGFLSCMQIVTARDRNLLYNTITLSSIIVATGVMYESIFLSANSYRGGVDVNPNYLSACISLGFIILVTRLAGVDSFWKRSISILGILICSYAMLILASRGTTIAVGIALFIFLLRALRNVFQAVFIFTGIAVLSFLLSGTPVVIKMMQRFSEAGVGTLNDRTPLWKAAWREIALREWLPFIFGSGTGSSTILVNSVNPLLTNIHNTYMQVFVELGLLGIVLLLITLLTSLFSKERTMGDLTVKLLTLDLMVIALTTTSSDLFQWWIIIGLGMVLPKLTKND